MPVILHEVGLRDGLQIEKAIVPTEQKIAWIEALVAAGVDIVQVGSFVHQQKVPADGGHRRAVHALRRPAHSRRARDSRRSC